MRPHARLHNRESSDTTTASHPKSAPHQAGNCPIEHSSGPTLSSGEEQFGQADGAAYAAQAYSKVYRFRRIEVERGHGRSVLLNGSILHFLIDAMRNRTEGGDPARVFAYDVDAKLHDPISGAQRAHAIEQEQIGHSELEVAPLSVGDHVIAAAKNCLSRPLLRIDQEVMEAAVSVRLNQAPLRRLQLPFRGLLRSFAPHGDRRALHRP